MIVKAPFRRFATRAERLVMNQKLAAAERLLHGQPIDYTRPYNGTRERPVFQSGVPRELDGRPNMKRSFDDE